MKLASYRISSHGSVEALVADEGAGRAQPEAPGDSTRRPTEFVAVEGGPETMSGGTLLVEAYAALWIILFGFVFVSWRRQSHIDVRIAELERAVSQGQGK
jgi:hypothetical protein